MVGMGIKFMHLHFYYKISFDPSVLPYFLSFALVFYTSSSMEQKQKKNSIATINPSRSFITQKDNSCQHSYVQSKAKGLEFKNFRQKISRPAKFLHFSEIYNPKKH